MPIERRISLRANVESNNEIKMGLARHTTLTLDFSGKVCKKNLLFSTDMIFGELGRDNINKPSIPVVEELEKDLIAELGSNAFVSDALNDEFCTRLVGKKLWCDSGNSTPTSNLVGSGRVDSSPPLVGNFTCCEDDYTTKKERVFLL